MVTLSAAIDPKLGELGISRRMSAVLSCGSGPSGNATPLFVLMTVLVLSLIGGGSPCA
jgi:hypothetical protein